MQYVLIVDIGYKDTILDCVYTNCGSLLVFSEHFFGFTIVSVMFDCILLSCCHFE